MISLDEAMLYAPVEWHDCSEGYTDIRYQKSTELLIRKLPFQRLVSFLSLVSFPFQRSFSPSFLYIS